MSTREGKARIEANEEIKILKEEVASLTSRLKNQVNINLHLMQELKASKDRGAVRSQLIRAWKQKHKKLEEQIKSLDTQLEIIESLLKPEIEK